MYLTPILNENFYLQVLLLAEQTSYLAFSLNCLLWKEKWFWVLSWLKVEPLPSYITARTVKMPITRKNKAAEWKELSLRCSAGL